MRDFQNIEKSAFRKGEYVGYGGGSVWRIRKSNSSYGNWSAVSATRRNEIVFAFRLEDLSRKLLLVEHKAA